ncbi:MAG TPA: hypothetical protein VFT55_06300 [Planctomycetota bacterium]|nr:hypothetical protein [Planctomycetota bacterium]
MRFFSTIVLCVSLAAQEAVAPFRFVPADSCLVVRTAAPAKWKQHFGKTQVAKLLGAETLAPFIAQANTAIDAGIEEIRSKGKFDADLLQRLLKDYTGDCVFSLQVDFSDAEAAFAGHRSPAMSVVCALTPDGSFDLGAMAIALQAFSEADAQENRSPLKDLMVGDQRLRVTSDGPLQVAVPFLHEGHLILLAASDLEKQAARLLGAADRFEGEVDARPLSVLAKLDGPVDMLMKVVAARMKERPAPFDIAQMLQDFGLRSLKFASLALGAEDKHVVSEFHLSLGDGERGLFSTVMLDQARPKLLRWVPGNSEAFSVGAFDAGALFAVVKSIWELMGDDVPITFEKAMEAFTEATKVRLEEELIAHLGTEMMTVGDAEAQIDAAALDETGSSPPILQGSCIGIALRNGKAFGESLEKILRSRGLHAARKTEDYADAQVHRMTLGAMLELEYVVTDDLLLLALGKDEAARRNLRVVLDVRAKPGEGGEVAPAVAAHIAAVPAGWSGISVTQVPQILEATSIVFGTLPVMVGVDDPEALDMAVSVMKGLAGEMKRFGLQVMISTSHTSERSLVQRLRW